jgi:hypothetical protein
LFSLLRANALDHELEEELRRINHLDEALGAGSSAQRRLFIDPCALSATLLFHTVARP